MGHTLKQLSKDKLKEEKAIFNNRFVVEVCEMIHFHYRNLRIALSLNDWIELAKGCRDSLSRWESMGKPEPSPKTHIELCRKQVAQDPKFNDSVEVNLNSNLYAQHEGKIFSEGAELDEPRYIHLKIRDLRLELRPSEFLQLAEAVAKAKEELCETQPS